MPGIQTLIAVHLLRSIPYFLLKEDKITQFLQGAGDNRRFTGLSQSDFSTRVVGENRKVSDLFEHGTAPYRSHEN